MNFVEYINNYAEHVMYVKLHAKKYDDTNELEYHFCKIHVDNNEILSPPSPVSYKEFKRYDIVRKLEGLNEPLWKLDSTTFVNPSKIRDSKPSGQYIKVFLENKTQDELISRDPLIKAKIKELVNKYNRFKKLVKQYNDITNFQNGIAFVLEENSKKWNFISEVGETIFKSDSEEPPIFLNSRLIRLKTGDKVSLVKKEKSNILYYGVYQDIRRCYEKRIAVKQFNKWGFLDEKGTDLIIPCIYDNVSDFELGYSFVTYTPADGRSPVNMLIDKMGRFIHLFDPENIATCEDIDSKYLCEILTHCYKTNVKKRFSQIIEKPLSDFLKLDSDKDFRFVTVEHDYERILPFAKNKVRVVENRKWGVYDVVKKEFIVGFECGYDRIDELIENRAIIKKGDKYGAIDENGNLEVKLEFDYIHDFSADGLAYATIDDNQGISKAGFIDGKGEIKIPFMFDVLKLDVKFDKGIANVCYKGKMFWIKKDGKGYLNPPPEYEKGFQ